MVLGEHAHLQLEVIHGSFRLLTPGLQRTSGMKHGVNAGVLTLLDRHDESGLTNLGVRDAPLPVEIRVSKSLGEGIVNLGEALGDGVIDLDKALLKAFLAVDEAGIPLPIRIGEA